jgi:hypothetical protein
MLYTIGRSIIAAKGIWIATGTVRTIQDVNFAEFARKCPYKAIRSRAQLKL